jgi:hypothetical protein
MSRRLVSAPSSACASLLGSAIRAGIAHDRAGWRLDAICWTVFVLLFCLNAAPSTGAAQRAPSRQQTFAMDSGMTYPYVDKGKLIRYVRQSADEKAPNIELVDLQSRAISKKTLWFDGAKTVQITSAALAGDGSVIVAGSTRTASGITAKYIAQINSAGSVTHVIRTNPYLALDLCVSNDGFVWTLGTISREDVPDSMRVLRKWSMTDGLAAALLPRKVLPAGLGRNPDPRFPTFLRCGLHSIILYSALDNVMVKVDQTSLEATILNVAPLQSDVRAITGFVYTENDEVFISTVQRTKNQPRGEFLRLIHPSGNSSAPHWEKTQEPQKTDGMLTILCGVDGREIVYAEQSPDAPYDSPVNLVWISPKDF